MERMRRGNGYPTHPVVIREIPVWGEEIAQDYIETRVQLHNNPDPLVCTSKDKWEKPTTYAVKKEGAKRALKVCQSNTEAQDYINDKGGDDLIIETRKGEAVRCLSYCTAKSFCNEAGKMEQEPIPF